MKSTFPTPPSKKLSALFTALVIGMGFTFPLFIAVIISGNIPALTFILAVGNVYLLTVLITSTIAALMGKIRTGISIAAGFLACTGVGLLLTLSMLLN